MVLGGGGGGVERRGADGWWAGGGGRALGGGPRAPLSEGLGFDEKPPWFFGCYLGGEGEPGLLWGGASWEGGGNFEGPMALVFLILKGAWGRGAVLFIFP